MNILRRYHGSIFTPTHTKLMTKMSNTKTSGFVGASNPKYLAERMKYLSAIKEQNSKLMQEMAKADITITLKNGREVRGRAFQTTPLQLMKNMPREVGETSIAAKIQYQKKYDSPFSDKIARTEPEEHCRIQEQDEIVDLTRPLEGDCSLQLVNFEDRIGRDIFWHSSAHLLGQSLQNVFGVWLCHGPNIDHGFFYDSFMGDYNISQSDYSKLQTQTKKYVRQKQKFQRIIINKKQALQLFQYNPFKKELILSKIPDGSMTTVYRCGSLVDLCTGPHIISADRVRGFKIMKNSAAYWHGDKQKEALQRVYGISYPKQSQLQQYIKQQEQLAKKDHRFIGQSQQLFSFSNLTPGSPFFLSHGTTIYNKLIDLMRSQYSIRGYQQVITPNIYHSQLWKMSGHYFKYSEHIYFMKEGHSEEEHGLKPMNCPGHCLAFNFGQKSYKDLPIRMAQFGVLHRNQIHGSLTGLTRVRRFQQDDAHIFCRHDQIMEQILGVLDLLDYIYSLFGFKYALELSTRPKEYLGELSEWEQAETQLKEALDKFGGEYRVNEGDGAFYGPKIDVKLMDVFERWHQCGTIQLDFQLPLRFDLQYRTGQTGKEEHQEQEIPVQKQNLSQEEKYSRSRPLKQGFSRPIIIHRAIFGSIQRFLAILCEQTGGKWDFWLSPRQIKLITVNQQCNDYAKKIFNSLKLKNYEVELDTKNDNLNKKIRKAQLQGFNFIGVIGKEQIVTNTVNIRRREEGKVLGNLALPQLIAYFQNLKPAKSKLRKQLEESLQF